MKKKESRKIKVCEYCNGTGIMKTKHNGEYITCDYCAGTGRKTIISLEVPFKVEDPLREDIQLKKIE